MKIYQLHECSGEYEDYRDRIIGSYLRKERAEEEKAKAEAKEQDLNKQEKKCQKCPFHGSEEKLEDLLQKYPKYCDKLDMLEEDEDYDMIYCDNHFFRFDESTYYIEEVEVEE